MMVDNLNRPEDGPEYDRIEPAISDIGEDDTVVVSRKTAESLRRLANRPEKTGK